MSIAAFFAYTFQIEPYIPYEFTCEGMLQRVNVLIEKQVGGMLVEGRERKDQICNQEKKKTFLIWFPFLSQDFCSSTGSWPPLSALQVVKAEVDTSCNQACQKEGLICEPAFFPHLNSAKSLAK